MPVNPFLAHASATETPAAPAPESTPSPTPAAPSDRAADTDPRPATELVLDKVLEPTAAAADTAKAPTPAPSAPTPTPSSSSVDAPAVTPEDQDGPRRRRRMSHAEVEQLRLDFSYARALAADGDAEMWETVTETETRLADQYAVSRSTVHNVVLGLTYPSAPGPIDVARRAAHDQYTEDRQVLGTGGARSRATHRRLHGSGVDSVLHVRATLPDGSAWARVFPLGTRVEVMTETAGGVADEGAGDDVDTTAGDAED